MIFLNMKKYKVRMVWETYIDFGVIEAESKEEVEEIINDRLATDTKLVEQEGETRLEIAEL